MQRTKSEKLEQIMAVIWRIQPSPQLRDFAAKIVSEAEIGAPDLDIKQQLGDFQIRKLDQDVSNHSCNEIVSWLRKVMAGDA